MSEPTDPRATAADESPADVSAERAAAPAPRQDDATRAAGEGLDLGAIERDLDGVELALRRLDDGTYWSDEVTGESIPDTVLAENPVERRSG